MKPQVITDWFPNWSNDITIIVASGPSANKVNLEPFRNNAKFIVVNNSWKLAPWADMLFAADGGWWQRNKGATDFSGIKVTLDALAAREFSIHLVKLHKGVTHISTDMKGFIGMVQNSGGYAINLAVQFGTKKIILVGFDMNVDAGLHWHGPHVKGLTNPSSFRMKIWTKLLDGQAKNFDKLGVEVINASQVSALTAYKKMSLSEALEFFAKPKEKAENVN